MQTILNSLVNNDGVKAICNLESGLGNLSLVEEAILIASAYQKEAKSYFIIKKNSYQAQKLYELLYAILPNDTLLFNIEESLRIEAIAKSPQARVASLEVMSKLCDDHPYICVLNAMGALRFQPTKKQFERHVFHLRLNDECTLNELKQRLFEAGYQACSRVEQPLCYASRGGIIDVFSINYEHPIRIEFFDTIVDSIRYFDPITQRTLELIDEIEILPANPLLFDDQQIADIVEAVNIEYEKNKKNMAMGYSELLYEQLQKDMDKIANYECDDYLYRYYAFLNHPYTICDYVENAVVILSSEDEINDHLKRLQQENIAYIQELFQEGIALPRFHLLEDIRVLKKRHKYLDIKMFQDYKHPIASQILECNYNDVAKEILIQQIIEEASNYKIVICIDLENLKELQSLLPQAKIIDNKIYDGINILLKPFPQSFNCINEKLHVYSGNEIFKKIKSFTHYNDKFHDAEVLKSYQELHVGDFIVHEKYGIGKYLGIETKEINNCHKDYLKIAYRGDDLLYVPVEHFSLVRKFVSKEGATPKLNKLGGKEWEKTKKKVSEKVALLAERLVNLYASREENIGHAFEKDDELQAEFEKDFPYQLTRDQQIAIKEIKSDMESSKPMDRLLCGDVGFGKTEVAAVAVFKAVSQGKQAAYLCPTTILSRQHYLTFKERFKNFPISIALVNRYISNSEMKQIIEGVKNGKIDIVIGTHRLLSKTIKYKDLGILIIDEEQRFGVEHKEKIKELKNGIDVLSLSATPIPRTMQMSLVGVRSLSHLDTPPLNRLPVQTYVIEKNEALIKDVIERELAREGQVFYLFNNVSEIYTVARKLRKMLPGVEIGVAHGRMKRDDIEDIMMAFTEKRYQVLVCTTIIETGIDIPNANTMIIDQADRFGLSQLYQIKGRVGRSDRLAYAYLLYSPNKQLSELAEKRLKAIKEFVQLGSGYKIAMRDLMIRGAGDMLGPQQSGFIDTVGLDMYLEMLNEAINKQKGIEVEKPKELKKANVTLDAYIPQNFENEDYEKLTLYQRIEKIHNMDEFKEIYEEIVDIYGKLPSNVKLLFEKKRLDIAINLHCVKDFIEEGKQVLIILTPEFSESVDGASFFTMINKISKNIKLGYSLGSIQVKVTKRGNWLALIVEILEQCDKMDKELGKKG